MNFKTLGAVLIAALVATLPVTAQDSDGADAAELKLDSDKAKMSYSLGAMFGDFVKDGADLVDLDIVIQAFVAIAEGGESALEQQEMDKLFAALQQQLGQRRTAVAKEAGIAFLAANGKKEGVVTTESGLQYKVLTKGSGESPTARDTVVAHYEGTLTDGTVFDSSYDRGTPLTIGAGQVISGWTEALVMMKPGSKWEVYIPYNLAYGERGSPPKIPAYSALVFTVELLEVKKAGLTIR